MCIFSFIDLTPRNIKTCVFLFISLGLWCQTPDCLQLTQLEFDGADCWRALAKAGNYEAAATLQLEFIKKGKVRNLTSLYWHVGQLYALDNQNEKAIHYMQKTQTVFTKWLGGEEGKTWYYFTKATMAFLQRDRATFNRILLKWERKFPKDKNYIELTRLDKNWELPYRQATQNP